MLDIGASDGDHKLVERVGDPVVIVAVDGEFVVASPDVLDKGMAGGHDDDRPGPSGPASASAGI